MRDMRAILITIIFVSCLALAVSPANGQTGSLAGVSSINKVSGPYVNAENRVHIVFPEGWVGTEMFSTGSVIASVFADGLEAGQNETIVSSMILVVTDKTLVEKPSTAKPVRVPENVEVQCEVGSTSNVQLAGLTGSESIVDCSTEEEAFKMKTVLVETDTKWIMISFMAPIDEYDKYVTHYDSALDTLQIGPIPDAEGDSIYDLRTTTQTVMVAGKAVEVEIRSSSTVTAFELDNQSKRISFQVDGETGTEGMTQLSIGRILEGPYVVTIDSQATDDFVIAPDQGSNEVFLILSYTHSTHDVKVTGTNVVPEFPVSVLGLIVAIVGVVSLLGRQSNIFRGFH